MAVRKKRVVRKRTPAKAKSSKKPVVADDRMFSRVKLGIVVKTLIIFILLFLISYILSVVISGTVLSNIFSFLWIIFAFVSLAFFIALLVLLLLKWMRR